MSAVATISAQMTAILNRAVPSINTQVAKSFPGLSTTVTATDTQDLRVLHYTFNITGDGTVSVALATGAVTSSVATTVKEFPAFVAEAFGTLTNLKAYAVAAESVGVQGMLTMTIENGGGTVVTIPMGIVSDTAGIGVISTAPPVDDTGDFTIVELTWAGSEAGTDNVTVHLLLAAAHA